MLMKKLFGILILVLFGFAFAPNAEAASLKKFKTWSTNNTSLTVPIQLYPEFLKVSRVTILGKKANRTDNVGDVYIGVTSGNDTQPYVLSAGGEIVITSMDGKTFDLNNWSLDVLNTGDGVIILYQ